MKRLNFGLLALLLSLGAFAVLGCQTPPKEVSFERPLPSGPEPELRNEVYKHLETLNKTGKLDESALAYLDRLEKADSLQARARISALLQPAVSKGAITKEEARARLLRMAKAAPDADEKAMFEAMAKNIAG